MSATQWIPACAGMTIEKNLKIKKLKNLSPRGPGPARRVAWVDADHGVQVNKVARMRDGINYWIASLRSQ